MSVSSALGPWYKFARIFGYFPYGLEERKSGRKELLHRCIGISFSIINIGLHTFLWWDIPFKVHYFQTTIGSRIEKTFNLVDSSVPVITILSNFVLLFKVRHLSKMLETTGKLFATVNVKLEETRRYSYLVLILVLLMHLFPFVLLPCLWDGEEIREMIPLGIYLTYRQLSNISFLGSITLLLITIFLRFKSINVCLFAIFPRKQRRDVVVSSEGETDDPVAIISVLSRVHQILCEGVDQINNIFSFQVSITKINTIFDHYIEFTFIYCVGVLLLVDNVLLRCVLWVLVDKCLLLLRDMFYKNLLGFG